MEPQSRIDEIDIKILGALFKDARCNFAEIAKNCKVSITAIAQRYKKMKQAGVISGTILITNMKNAGDEGTMAVDIIAETDCEDAIVEVIRKLPGVINCCRVIGKYDIHAAVRVGSIEQIDNVFNTIKKVKGVLQIETAGFMDKLRYHPENLLRKTREKEEM